MESETWVLESVAAKNLGVSRSVLAEYRKKTLMQNRHWRLNHNQVEILEEALHNISTTLGATPPGQEAEPDSTTPAPPAAEPEVVELEVIRVYPNPRLLAAKTAGGFVVQVLVPKNRNFRPRMQIKARRGPGSAYYLEGRCPRYPGRW